MDERPKLDLQGDCHKKWREWLAEAANIINAVSVGAAGSWNTSVEEVMSNHKRNVQVRTLETAKMVLTKDWMKEKKFVELESNVRSKLYEAMPARVQRRAKAKSDVKDDTADLMQQAAIMAGPGSKINK